MTSVSDILDQLIGALPTSKANLITEAIGYLSALGYTVAEADADSSDWAIARLAERIFSKQKLFEQGKTDHAQLQLATTFDLMTDEIERLLSQANRKTYVKSYNFKPISSTLNWTNSS
ncbi:hypothetical protein LCGC14_1257440 [marine sediment metagenome]|uniref:Uncharacterized protein n=1 Tax=marine sediment metagenome TaxID=412755 RepID=A0A0F9LN08_9ZZZZ